MYPYTKIDWNWIKDTNVSAKTIKLLEENTGINLYNLRLSKEFLNMKKSMNNRRKIRVEINEIDTETNNSK